MTLYAALRRESHAGDFVVGLDAARIMQNIQRSRWIDALDAKTVGAIVDLTDQHAFAAIPRQTL